MTELKYYSFQEILKFLGFEHRFKMVDRKYPFNRPKENVEFSWGQILIPKYGIRETVQNKLSDIKDRPINEIVMMYQIPFYVDNRTCGLINQNISLSFRYDKEYKYGDITRSIYECCFWILEHADETNDFYIITDNVQEFFSYCIIDNQWGLGNMKICSQPNEYFGEYCDTE